MVRPLSLSKLSQMAVSRISGGRSPSAATDASSGLSGTSLICMRTQKHSRGPSVAPGCLALPYRQTMYPARGMTGQSEGVLFEGFSLAG